jgi:NAD(P)-dependent dehydrogenase (short-subunit alcohol dehydrogenase family)
MGRSTPQGNLNLWPHGKPEEIGKAVAFFASNDASYLTGIELFVDGGFAQVKIAGEDIGR